MKNFMQTPKQKRAAIAVNKTCLVNSRKPKWQPKDAVFGSYNQVADNACRDMCKRYGW